MALQPINGHGDFPLRCNTGISAEMIRLIRTILAPLAIALALLAAPAQAAQKTLLIFGDSLMAGLGLSQDESFVGQLQAALSKAGLDVRVINGGASGDTTATGLARLDWALGDKPDAAILELGANDMLQGIAPATARANLSAMLEKFAAAKVPVLLAGMKANRGLGADYTTAFDAIYPDLAKQDGVAFYPFYLDGVALDPKLNQDDMLHPNAAGVTVIVGKMLPVVEGLLK
jgi:acyl-CoA thioesterase-1